MIDFDRIPRPIYDELVDLFGKEKAENYIKKVNYNVSTINRDLFWLKVDKFYKRNKFQLILILILILGAIVFTFIL